MTVEFSFPVLSSQKTHFPLLLFVRHQHAAGSITFLGHFEKRHHDGFAARLRLFHHGIRNTLRNLPLLVSRAPLQHSDLN